MVAGRIMAKLAVPGRGDKPNDLVPGIGSDLAAQHRSLRRIAITMPRNNEARGAEPPARPAREAKQNWNDPGSDEQTLLLVEYGHYLDGLPPTCSM